MTDTNSTVINTRQRIWLDVDTGHDVSYVVSKDPACYFTGPNSSIHMRPSLTSNKDAYALLLAALHPNLNLIGVSTVHGNASLANTTRNTCAVLQALGRPDVPVIKGLAKPVVREAVHAPEYHGHTGLDGVTLLPDVPDRKLEELPEGIAEMHRIIDAQLKESIVLIATGPLTNLGQLLASYPDIFWKFDSISIMGGAVGDGFSDAPMHRTDGPGNWSQWAEFNIFCDPEAAEFVFTRLRNFTKIYLATLDLTHQCRADEVVFEKLFPKNEKTTAVRRMMEEVMQYFRDSYRKHANGANDGPPLHDAVAVYAALGLDEYVAEADRPRYQVQVVTEGEQDGRTIVSPLQSRLEGVVLPKRINLGKFWNEIQLCLDLADKISPMR